MPICAPVCAEAENAVKPPMHVPSPSAASGHASTRAAESDAPDAFDVPSREVWRSCDACNSGQSYERKHLLRELEARSVRGPVLERRFEDIPLIAENRTLKPAP